MSMDAESKADQLRKWIELASVNFDSATLPFELLDTALAEARDESINETKSRRSAYESVSPNALARRKVTCEVVYYRYAINNKCYVMDATRYDEKTDDSRFRIELDRATVNFNAPVKKRPPTDAEIVERVRNLADDTSVTRFTHEMLQRASRRGRR